VVLYNLVIFENFLLLSAVVVWVGLQQNISLDTRRGVNAILNRDFQYEARYSTDLNDYICQFSG